MGRPNAGGGRNNQDNNKLPSAGGVPRRAMFSNFGGGKGGGKDDGKGKRDRDSKGKGSKPVFESQKEMDKWKGQQKGSSQAAPAAAQPHGPQGGQAASFWQATEVPSYVHGVFCLTHDDHVVLEPLLTDQVKGCKADQELSPEIAQEAAEHLRSLGFLQNRVTPALEVIAPQLLWELAEKEAQVTVKAVAERALEWLCSVTEERQLPSKLREPREVTAWRKRQEERNTSFQTRALMMGGEIDSMDIARVEKLGFSRAKAIEALSRAPGHSLIPAVKALLSVYLPLEADAEAAEMASSLAELKEEAEALQGAYGVEAVDIEASHRSFEVSVAIPETEWHMAAMIPDGFPYPAVAPLLCPKHPRLREANRPRLLAALGEVCRDILGTPMLFALCEWILSDGESFLVRADATEKLEKKAERNPNMAPAAVQRALTASEEQKAQEEEANQVRDGRVQFLKKLQEDEEQASKPASQVKDKIALEIRNDPFSAGQQDLAGYDDARVKELVRAAFSQPIESCDGQMARVTFIIGGGKSVRQKYPDTLGRVLGTALQDLGFTQDSTASSTFESGGTFKAQHDTGRNLKLVHVFPRMFKPAVATQAAESVGALHRRLAGSAWADFLEEVSPWVRSREGRPRVELLLQHLEATAADLQEVDAKLRDGRPVSEAQRRLYDEVGGSEDVSEKVRWLTNELAKKRPKGAAAATDGAVFDIEAPTRLQEAARLAGTAEQPVAAAGVEEEESDATLLRRRIEQTRGESERMKAYFAIPKPLQDIRHSLPAFGERENIRTALREGQVVVVEGDTGCGKSTQVPQYILEDWVQRGEGGAVNIIMTQPRRISAIGVAERIASEMDDTIGNLAGYSIRLESKKSKNTKIMVLTTGVLLRRLENDRSLRGVTHIVVDECHERDLDTDFLLIVLRDLLPKRPNLRVILMSATINADIFREYFQGCYSIHIPGRTFPVTSYYLEHALQHTGFIVEPGSEYSKRDYEPLAHQEAAELAQAYERPEFWDMMGGPVQPRILEQMHRMDPDRINFDLVASVVRHIHTQVDPVKHGKSPGAILVFVPGFGEIKKCIRAITDDDPSQQRGGGKGGGWDQGGGKGGGWNQGASTGASNGLWVLPLHSMISVAEQRLVFKRPERGLRKVVITTNIAETSITIDDVEYVVDCGRHKQTKYDPANRISMLVDCVETKANGKQRRGRAGRVKAGVCYHLLNIRKWRRLEDFEKPEMLRVPLDSLCLRISLLNLGHPARFLAKAITPPTQAAVQSSLQQLVELSAVELVQRRGAEDEAGDADKAWDREDQERLLKAKLKLTPLGAHLASLPVDAGMGKLLVLGCLFGIPRDVCLLAAALTSKSPFKAGIGNKKEEGDKRRLEMASKFVDGALESDHLLLVALFQQWEKLGGKGSSAARSWCYTNNLDLQTFETVADMRGHLLGVLVEQGFIRHTSKEKRHGAQSVTAGGRWNRAAKQGASRDEVSSWMPPCLSSIAAATEEFDRRKRQLLRCLLCAALWPNVVLRKDGQLTARNQSSLTFHPSSILGIQEAGAKQAQAGDWSCPSCGFFCFGTREECPQCWTSKPPPGPQKATNKQLRHGAFMYGEKVRTVANPSQPGKKAQTHVRDCCGVPLKALFLLGHRIIPDYHSGRASVDGWIHCQAAPRDVAMLLGLRRRLQEVLRRMLSKPCLEVAPGGEDPEVIDAVTSVMVLDVE